MEPTRSQAIAGTSTFPATRWPTPATLSSAAACAMSVPTTYFAASGYARSMASAKSVPLPTEVSPTMKPPTRPIETATIRSRRVR